MPSQQQNSHKMTLKRCLMSRSSPDWGDLLVWCPTFLCEDQRFPEHGNSSCYFYGDWELSASEMNSNNYSVCQNE